LHEELLDDTCVEDFNINDALLRLHHGDDIAALDLRTRLYEPLYECAGFHIGAQTGHAKLSHWRVPFS
jgi:hypothetical protein